MTIKEIDRGGEYALVSLTGAEYEIFLAGQEVLTGREEDPDGVKLLAAYHIELKVIRLLSQAGFKPRRGITAWDDRTQEVKVE